MTEREKLLSETRKDIQSASEAMDEENYLAADLYLKLASDQLKDTGLIP